MNVWTNTLVRRSNGGEVQPGFGFPHSLIAALQEEAWLQQLSTINCHLIPPPANHYYSAHEHCDVAAIDRNRPPRLLILNFFRTCEIRAIRGELFRRTIGRLPAYPWR